MGNKMVEKIEGKILLVVPAYNEGANIERVISELQYNYPCYNYVVVNDGSSDNTAAICKKNKYNLVDLPVNIGLAGAFQAGMKYANRCGYSYAIQYDGDGQHDARYIAEMLRVVEEHRCDIVIGSRYVNVKKPWTARMIGSRLIATCIQLTTGKKVKDPTSGMRLYNRKMIEILAEKVNYGPEPDTLAYLIRCGAKVQECQVSMRERIAGESYLKLGNTIRYMTRMCMSILVVQWFRRKV